MYTKLVCRILGHKFNQWKYENVGECNQYLYCSRCGIYGSRNRLFHEWSYQNDKGTCWLTTKCNRCGKIEEKVNHLWSNWCVLDDQEHRRVCTRNQDHEETEQHSFRIEENFRREVTPQGGRCVDPHTGWCNDYVVNKKIERAYCISCGYTKDLGENVESIED